jgi:PhnB protein
VRLSPHLQFNGNCQAAFRFYQKALGGKITFSMTYGESPAAAHVDPKWHSKIIHATFTLGDQSFSGADHLGEHYRTPQGFSVSLDVNDPAEAERVFNALAENAAVEMPIQETFWAQRFAVLVDQFGIPWMVNCGKPPAG